jgi:quercetin dioxygenase-like cupin family protein
VWDVRERGTATAMQSWDLRTIELPDGSRSPVVLDSDDAARAILIGLDPGQQLGEHEVKERAFVLVVEGAVRVEAAGDGVDAGAGTLFLFTPGERHAVSSSEGARLLLFLAPWPGAGHYRGDQQAAPAGR